MNAGILGTLLGTGLLSCCLVALGLAVAFPSGFYDRRFRLTSQQALSTTLFKCEFLEKKTQVWFYTSQVRI